MSFKPHNQTNHCFQTPYADVSAEHTAQCLSSLHLNLRLSFKSHFWDTSNPTRCSLRHMRIRNTDSSYIFDSLTSHEIHDTTIPIPNTTPYPDPPICQIFHFSIPHTHPNKNSKTEPWLTSQTIKPDTYSYQLYHKLLTKTTATVQQCPSFQTRSFFFLYYKQKKSDQAGPKDSALSLPSCFSRSILRKLPHEQQQV